MVVPPQWWNGGFKTIVTSSIWIIPSINGWSNKRVLQSAIGLLVMITRVAYILYTYIYIYIFIMYNYICVLNCIYTIYIYTSHYINHHNPFWLHNGITHFSWRLTITRLTKTRCDRDPPSSWDGWDGWVTGNQQRIRCAIYHSTESIL